MLTPDKPPLELEEKPILTLIQQIKDGLVAPDTIDKDLRQQAIEVLMAEGYAVASMAQVFKKCDKTIRRDLEEIRQRHELVPDAGLAKRIIGEMLVFARGHRDHLMRLARTKDTSVSEKAQAEYLAARVTMELVDKLQSLGYLPTQPKAVVGDIFHHLNGTDLEGALKEMSQQCAEVEKMVIGNDNLPPEIQKDLIEVKAVIKKAQALEPAKDGKRGKDGHAAE